MNKNGNIQTTEKASLMKFKEPEVDVKKVKRQFEHFKKKIELDNMDDSVEAMSNMAVRPKLSHCEQRVIDKFKKKVSTLFQFCD